MNASVLVMMVRGGAFAFPEFKRCKIPQRDVLFTLLDFVEMIERNIPESLSVPCAWPKNLNGFDG